VLNYLTYVALSVPISLFVPCDVVLGMTDPPFEGIVAALVALLKANHWCTTFAICIQRCDGRIYRRTRDADEGMGGAAQVGAAEVDARCSVGRDMRARIVAKGVKAELISV